MSRGTGRIQQELLAILDRHSGALDTFDLAAKAYALQPGKDGVIELTDAHLVSARRALQGLARADKIYRLGRGKRLLWSNVRVGLWATIRDMQQTSLALAELGDWEALESHIDKMKPLLERAHTLGVNVNSETPPTAR